MKKLLLLLFLAPIILFVLTGLLLLGVSTGIIGGARPSTTAVMDIPANYLALYEAAADTCPGLPWQVLAGIGKEESDHGRSTLPGVSSGENFAGAAGPMQMGIDPTKPAGAAFWKYATVDVDGGGISPYSPADEIFAAANYLCANGAAGGRNISNAIFQYNHAQWYVDKVLGFASAYASQTVLPPGASEQQVINQVVTFAWNQLGHPYQWGAVGQHGFYDCSGLVLAAYRTAGIELPRTAAEQWHAGARIYDLSALQPGDLVFYASNLNDPSTIHHVGIYIGAGNMIDAPHTGAVVRIEPFMRGDFIGAVRPTLSPAANAMAGP
jgi:hypothetical protein